MYINISYKFHRIPNRHSRFIAQVHDLLGQPSYLTTKGLHFVPYLYPYFEYACRECSGESVLFDLILYVPSCRDESSWVEPLLS